MIVESSGHSQSDSSVQCRTSKIVSCTGTAYTKKGKLNAVIRIIKRAVRRVKSFVKNFREFFFVMKMNTKSGIPTNLAPPSNNTTSSN